MRPGTNKRGRPLEYADKLKGKQQPDSSLRDTENVPLNEDLNVYFKREVLPHAPEGWEVLQLKRLIAIQNGADHKLIEQEEGFPVIGSGGIFAYASKFIYDGESVLLGRKGTIDKPLYVSGKFWTVDTMYWSKIRPGVQGKFVYYVALTIPFSYYSPNTALPSMTKGALDSHTVVCPPLPEQHTIAAFLDRETGKIDQMIQAVVGQGFSQTADGKSLVGLLAAP